MKKETKEIGTLMRQRGFVSNTPFDRDNVFELGIVIRRLLLTHGYDLVLAATSKFLETTKRAYAIRQKAPYFSTAAESIIQRLKSDQAAKNKQKITFAEFELAVKGRDKEKIVGMREMASHLELEDFCIFLQLTNENFPKDYYEILMYFVKEFKWNSKKIINRFFNKDLTPRKEIA